MPKQKKGKSDNFYRVVAIVGSTVIVFFLSAFIVGLAETHLDDTVNIFGAPFSLQYFIVGVMTTLLASYIYYLYRKAR